MYNDIYKTFDNDTFTYDYPLGFDNNKCKKDYMVSKYTPTYDIDYGDSIKLPFKISDNFIHYTILLTIYNFRYEPIYQNEYSVDYDNLIYLDIDCDMSKDLLKKGVYYVQLQAVEHKLLDNGETSYLNVCTIMSNDECSIHIR